MKDKIEFIAFDADDTLWESELYIQEFEHKFCNLLTRVRDKDCVKNRVKRAKIVRFTLC